MTRRRVIPIPIDSPLRARSGAFHPECPALARSARSFDAEAPALDAPAAGDGFKDAIGR